ncbi:rhodanese-like domain-containing protein [Salinarchaeum laminariae]|uniref:rhodanese-like domain-containing protein n=1 Tax=Salinarchaeum laminariae TaxID=869888 RepID=UPI0020BE6635|nr:rhodanese-like domain-containing protein [Salinarchaeum laminariae]
MNRRSFLATGVATSAGLLAGCVGGQGDGGNAEADVEIGTAPDPSVTEAGLAPETGDVAAPGVEVDELETNTANAEAVPLLPIDAAYDWYRRRDARFVDARKSMAQYEQSHVAGAVFSPAPKGYEDADPTDAWPEAERIVTYCGCPHHLSSQRASSLIANGHEAVFALDEGFGEWFEREYPMRSSSGAVSLAEQRFVTGAVDPSYAGEFVNLSHESTGQLEPAKVAADGSFEVSFRFVDVDAESVLRLETPAWTRTGTLAGLTSGTVRQ